MMHPDYLIPKPGMPSASVLVRVCSCVCARACMASCACGVAGTPARQGGPHAPRAACSPCRMLPVPHAPRAACSPCRMLPVIRHPGGYSLGIILAGKRRRGRCASL